MPEKSRFPGELLGAHGAGEERARRVVDNLEMPLQAIANVEAFIAEIALVAAFRFVGAVLVGEYLLAAGDVVGG